MSSSFHPKKKQKISSFSSSSSSEAKWPFDVFLSFRGEDVRHGFLADLHKCLLHRGINAYIDSEDLRPGDQISPALTKAIEESRIAVLVFSKNYASSRWCLDELVKVMECKELKGQLVLPVFYGVEPREVRWPRESFGKALARHEEKLGKGSERVEKWRQALFEAANLSGWHYDHGDGTEFIEKIVKEISTTVARVPLSVAKYPVGVGCRVEKVMSLLSMGSDDVRMIGIWGTGGSGKTTIAKDVYNRIYRQFDGCSFLANVRETSSRPDGLVHLQKKLLSQILWKRDLALLSVDGGANLIRDRLCCRKILLVLDDVDHGDQLNALARECAWFGKGSRIIITTRDKHVLTSCGKDQVYEVDLLDQGEAFELLSSHAFQGNQTKDISRDLIDNILDYVKSLPLAIVVLGAFLHGRSRGEWESTLETLAGSPNKDINNVLKISFDALDNNQKNIFLDIACFFKGRKRDYITRVLDSCGLQTLIGIQTLIERSLVTIEYDSIVQMHDLIELMGQDIVKQQYPDDPGKRSRLWCYDDVFEVLSEDTGTDAVKGIVLRLPTQKELVISPSAFTRMRRLKVLIVQNAEINGGPICLPNDLRWLEWPGCPLSTPVCVPKKLVCFDVPNSQIVGFGGNLKDLKNLKFVDLSKCQSLVCIPDLSYTPNLEELDLSGCKNLERAHDSFVYHHKLQWLNLSGCYKLQRFLDILNKNESLQEVSLQRTKELPTSIGNLVSSEKMYIFDGKKLAILASGIYKLQNLESLQLKGYPKLTACPKEEEDLREPHKKMGFPMLSGKIFTKIPTWEETYRLQFWNDSHGCPVPSNICDIEDVELYSSGESVHNGFPKLEKFHRKRNCRIVLPGGEMPKWLLPNREGYISFVASKDLYKKILGVAFCVVFQLEARKAAEASVYPYELIGYVNCKGIKHRRSVRPFGWDHVWYEYMESKDFNLDYVWLEYMESKDLWPVDHFGPNDSGDFYFGIRACGFDVDTRNEGLVKNCGFRLICKPLENDLEVLLQDNKLLDLALLCEVSHGDNLMSTKEESSSKMEDLGDCEGCQKFKGCNIVDISIERHRYSSFWSCYRNVSPEREMPKGFVLIEDGTISFKASQDLYNQFIGLYLCVVFGVKDGIKEVSFDIIPRVNSQRRNELSGTLVLFDMDHTWFQLFTPNALWGLLQGEVEFGQFDKRYLRFSLNIRVAGATVKKMGYVMQSNPLEDALKVELEKNRLMDPASLLEHRENPLYYGSGGWKDLCKRLEDMHGGRDSIY